MDNSRVYTDMQCRDVVMKTTDWSPGKWPGSCWCRCCRVWEAVGGWIFRSSSCLVDDNLMVLQVMAEHASQISSPSHTVKDGTHPLFEERELALSPLQHAGGTG